MRKVAIAALMILIVAAGSLSSEADDKMTFYQPAQKFVVFDSFNSPLFLQL
jgi:hypothetical protein